MNKIEFKNAPDTSTPLSAENLNQIQDNIEGAIDNIEGAIDNATGRISAIETSVERLEPNIAVAHIAGANIYSEVANVGINTWLENFRMGDKLSVTSNGIVVGAEVSYIRVNAQSYYRYLTTKGTAEIILQITKNGEPQASTYWSRLETNNQNVGLSITPTVIPVTEGDVISLKTVGMQGGYLAGTHENRGMTTYINAEVID